MKLYSLEEMAGTSEIIMLNKAAARWGWDSPGKIGNCTEVQRRKHSNRYIYMSYLRC